MTPDVSVIIVSYNTKALTLECLRSVRLQTRAMNFELLVVDNASTDGSAGAIVQEQPDVRLFALNENLGFAAANNLAAGEANGEWLLLLNPDTVVLDGAIDKLMAFAKAAEAAYPDAGIFGGRTLFADGTLNPTSCWAAPTLWSMFCIGTGLTSLFRGSRLFNPESMPRWKRDSVREVDIVTGCFLLLRRSLWKRLGGFDPAFFIYGEEADLCLRARKLGVRCLIYPDATIIHYGGASERVRSGKMVRLFKAKAQLFQKHWSPVQARILITMLDLWAATRYSGFSILGWFAVRFRPSAATWREVWENRREWRYSPARWPIEKSAVAVAKP